jgi:hypothetical protein
MRHGVIQVCFVRVKTLTIIKYTSTLAIPLNYVYQHFNTCLTGDGVPPNCNDKTDNGIYEIICTNILCKPYELYKYAVWQNAFFLALQTAV